MISQADLDRFACDGFVVVPDVFTPDEMKRFQTVVDAAVQARDGVVAQPMAERSVYDRMFTQYYNLWESSLEVRAFTFDRRLAGIVSQLLGVPALRVYCDQTFYKDPGSSETGVHQDYALLSIEETQTVN